MGQSSMFNFILGNNHRPASTDTVIDVKHTVLAISWLAINQTVCVSLEIFGVLFIHFCASLTLKMHNIENGRTAFGMVKSYLS